MIPFDFEYYRPDTIKEAVEIFDHLDQENKGPVYYGGGTELISMARLGNLQYGAVIDIKNIPECKILDYHKDELLLGSALTLTEIKDSKQFPLLSKTAGRIADHTMQGKITLGGNLSSTIIYRETVLPLLLSDARISVAGINGIKEYEISNIFDERLHLKKGELLIKATINKCFLEAAYFHIKKTKNEKIDYPLITTTALIKDNKIRIAFSGLAPYPFRNNQLEDIINNSALNFQERALGIISTVNDLILDNQDGSKEYRKFVLKNTIINLLETFVKEN